ncbi:MAG: hypothetical protein H6707_09080 [Deltaproteobacteria bacterium]|nr:hypothetical protein [Deltaproteobacteria bacterium]
MSTLSKINLTLVCAALLCSGCGTLDPDTANPGAGKAEPFDVSNSVGLLHPALASANYQYYYPQMSSGESDETPFASSWWAMYKGGVAYRWQGDTTLWDVADKDALTIVADTNLENLAPTEKYDLLFHANRTQWADCAGRVVDKNGKGLADWNDFIDKRDKGEAYCASWAYADWNDQYDRIKRVREQARLAGDYWSYDNDDHWPTTSPSTTRIVQVAGPATQWELLNHGPFGSVSTEGWFGHCNGWAAYVSAEPNAYPRRSVRVKIVNGKITECLEGDTSADCMTFRKGDIEGLMTEVYFQANSSLIGGRCEQTDTEAELDKFGRYKAAECRDLNPATFHIALVGLLGYGVAEPGETARHRLSFVADVSTGQAVWNYPILSYQVAEQKELNRKQAVALLIADVDQDALKRKERRRYVLNKDAKRFIHIKMNYRTRSTASGTIALNTTADARYASASDRSMEYLLELDSDSRILGGEWLGGSKTSHPDFTWLARAPRDMLPDPTGADNPWIAYENVKALLDCANDAATCAPLN